MPWPPGEETPTSSECAGAGAAVDVMGLTSMQAPTAGPYSLHFPSKANRLAGLGAGRPPIKREDKLRWLNVRKLHNFL
jgi:hypothetical protein